MYRVRDVAKRLDVSTSLVYALVAAGKLRCARIGLGRGQIRFKEEHIEEFLDRCTRDVRAEAPPASLPHLKHVRIRRP